MSARCCQAEGCTENLVALGKPYFLKKKICERHMRAEEVHKSGCGDSLWRFCQQCGRLELLSNFDGAKRNCRTSLRRRKHQPEQQLMLSNFSGSSSKLRKQGSDQCSKLKRQNSCNTSVTEDDVVQGFEPDLNAAATGACTAAAAAAAWGSSITEHAGAVAQGGGCSDSLSLDHVYAQIQQQRQQQLMLEQQLHSMMPTGADTCTAEHLAFGVGLGAQLATEVSTSASPSALPANLPAHLGGFGHMERTASASSSAEEAMQAHVESVMMAELVSELNKAQQQQQPVLQPPTLSQQQMHRVGLPAFGAATPCDAGSRNLPTLPLRAQPVLQQQQQHMLLPPSCQQQPGCLSNCHSSSCAQQLQCMPHGYAPAPAPAACAVSCFDVPSSCSVAPPAVAAVRAVGAATPGFIPMDQAAGRDPVLADRLQTLTTQMAQMQAMLLQMQQSLEVARRQ